VFLGYFYLAWNQCVAKNGEDKVLDRYGMGQVGARIPRIGQFWGKRELGDLH